MKIAIDISPLQKENLHKHNVRGIGYYIDHLTSSLKKYFPENSYDLITEKSDMQKYDTIHYPYFEPFFLTLPIPKDIKKIVTVHDVIPLVFPEHFPKGIKGTVKWWLQRRNLSHMDAILTDSYASKKDIVQYAGVREEKIHVVYLAASEEFKKITIDEKEKKELINKYALPKEFLLYVGDVTWNKNLPRIIDAAITADLPLLMVGKALQEEKIIDNPWTEDLRLVREKSKITSTLYTLGFVPTKDLVMLYNMASAFVMPSLYEGFGLPILEAMSCGCPVITSQSGSIPEIAENAAYYVNAYDSKSIAAGIKDVMYNKKLKDTLSKNGLTQSKKFSWEKTAEQTLRIYKS